MFNFFCTLALAIYQGSWNTYSNRVLIDVFIKYLKSVPIFGMFNHSTEAFYNTSTIVDAGLNNYPPDLAVTIAVILSTICCISVFFIIVKAIKKLFTCFLDF